MKRNTILFDINETVLNLAPLQAQFTHFFADASVATLWFAKLLHTSTVSALTGVKTDFATLAANMLDAIAVEKNVQLSETSKATILSTFATLPAHQDITSALMTLKEKGYRTVAFSNSSQQLISKQIQNAGLMPYFDDIISVEECNSFKPDPKVYQFVAAYLKQPLNTLRLVATHDWDTHGAMSVGMLSAYIKRSTEHYHAHYIQPTIIATNMNDIVDKILEEDRLFHQSLA